MSGVREWEQKKKKWNVNEQLVAGSWSHKTISAQFWIIIKSEKIERYTYGTESVWKWLNEKMWSHSLCLSTKRVKLITSPAKCYCFGLYRYGIVHTNKVAVAWYSRGGIHVFPLMLLFLLLFIFLCEMMPCRFHSLTRSLALCLYMCVRIYMRSVFASLWFSLLCAWHLVLSIKSWILNECTMCSCSFYLNVSAALHIFSPIFFPFYLSFPFILFRFLAVYSVCSYQFLLFKSCVLHLP